MKLRAGKILVAAVSVSVLLLGAGVSAAPLPQGTGEKFEASFPASAHAGAITGRVFVVVSTKGEAEPRLTAGGWGDWGPLFGVDVNGLAPEQSAVIDASTPGAPVRSLRGMLESVRIWIGDLR